MKMVCSPTKHGWRIERAVWLISSKDPERYVTIKFFHSRVTGYKDYKVSKIDNRKRGTVVLNEDIFENWQEAKKTALEWAED